MPSVSAGKDVVVASTGRVVNRTSVGGNRVLSVDGCGVRAAIGSVGWAGEFVGLEVAEIGGWMPVTTVTICSNA